MPVTYQSTNTPVATATTTLTMSNPVCIGNDILLAYIHSGNNVAVTAPSTDTTRGWTLITETTNTTIQIGYLAWKRAANADSGVSNAWTVGGTTISFGSITAFRGCRQQGLPYGTFTTSANSSADDVTYATLAVGGGGGNAFGGGELPLVVAIGYYAEAPTNAGAFSGTDPTFTERVDAEDDVTAPGASLFLHTGPSLTGIVTGARTCASASTTDAISLGILLNLLPQVEQGGNSNRDLATYSRILRIR